MSNLAERLHEHDFIDLHNNEPNPRVRIRLLALQHKKEGANFVQIGKVFKKRRQTISDWCSWFEEYGLEGLYDEQRSGRKPILPREKEEGFLKALCDLQSNRTGGRITAADIQNLLKEKFKSKYSVDGVYDLLDRLNIVWITGRSIHPKADKEKQEEFKKKLSRVNKKMSSSRYSPR